MKLKEKTEDWKKRPDILGSEGQAALIVGSIAAETGEDIFQNIKTALKGSIAPWNDA